MPDIKSDDAVLAVILERLERLSDDFKELKTDVSEEIAKARTEAKADSKSLGEKVDSQQAVLNKAKGGWLVLTGLGLLLTYTFGVWEKGFKLLTGG